MTNPYFYIIINVILTFIFILIPGLINLARRKYNLPLMWKKSPCVLLLCRGEVKDEPMGFIVAIVFGILGFIPISIVYIIYRLCRRLILAVAFSKEEKVQIAVGSITSNGDKK